MKKSVITYTILLIAFFSNDLVIAQGLGIGVATPDALFEIEDAATSDIHIRTTNVGLDYGSVLRLVEGPNFRGGYMQYDGAGNDLIIGVHDLDNTVTANDAEVLTITRPNGATIF